jgi:hypothetical protein
MVPAPTWSRLGVKQARLRGGQTAVRDPDRTSVVRRGKREDDRSTAMRTSKNQQKALSRGIYPLTLYLALEILQMEVILAPRNWGATNDECLFFLFDFRLSENVFERPLSRRQNEYLCSFAA